MPQRVTLPWQSDMQLAGKLVLSAAALLLLTLAYRFYKSRSLAGGTTPLADAGGEQRENAAQDGGEAAGLRRRRVVGEGARRGGGDAQGSGRGSATGTRHTARRGDQGLPRGEEEEEEEEGMDAALGLTCGRAGMGSRGSELGKRSGSELGSKSGSEPGNGPGSKLGSKPENKLGSELGSKPGSEPGSKPSSYQPGDVTKTPSSLGEEGTRAPSTGISPGIASTQTAGDECAQSTEQDLAGRTMSRVAEGMVQTLSVTSDLGLTMTASNAGSDSSYSFSSVAKIQVEENYIAKQRAKDGAGQPVPGLKGKVYHYYVQSVSHSVSKKRSLPYIPLGTSQHCSSEQVNKELQSFATQEPDPTLTTQEPTTPSIVPPPTGSLDISPEPLSPGRKGSILQIADSPHLQLPMEGFGVTAPADTPSASPGPGVVASSDLFQMTPPTHLDLGNCYKVLCTAKAQKLGHLQEAAYKVMSDNYLQVLKTPSIYSHLNAGERELILRRRMKGRMYMAVADINAQDPGLHTSRLCYYDDRGDCWRHLSHVPPEVVSRGCAMCSMFNYLFVVAGCEGRGQTQRPSNRVFCYDPLTNIWREICPLNQARPHCKLVALDGHLYAIGGECLYTVECYDPRQDRWTFTAPLPHDTFAVAHMATVCDGEIYVTGGTLRYMLLCYTARSDSWRVSLAGSSKDRTAEMVSANGFIYRFDLHRSTGISVYRCSAKARLWYKCATYATSNLSGFQCAVVGNLVHCVGRHFHIRFLADHISPRFGTKDLQPFPSPHGSLLPAVLVLPEGGMAQTQV
ncbi:kelch domain-containing protein 7A [Falco peregrinus]|uniref:kelch domain-containing protein 7A n=1 Tax=Falco peregrinus TaxID=8954 RepID=UPI00247891AA|nr:kelch domain-containing protein 7A [Falco peregrinus]